MTRELAERLERIEARLAHLERGTRSTPEQLPEADAFWALEALKTRAQDVVLFTGAVTLPTGEHYEWQESRTLEDLLVLEPTSSAAGFDALAHPIRVLSCSTSCAVYAPPPSSSTLAEFGTSGQLYHHLRQLVAQGWLQLVGRGHYQVPPQRVIPLLVVLAGGRR